MRARNIKPGFFIDKKIGKLSGNEKILFVGLWCLADREGFFRYDIEEIKVQIFPYETKMNIEKMLCNLMSLNVITCNDGIGYIPKFEKHQRPHPHEAKSEISEELKNALKSSVIKCHDMSLNVTKCKPDIRNDDIRNDDIRNDDIRKEESSASLSFENLWKMYDIPNKGSKKQALAEYKKLKPQNGTLSKMENAIKAQLTNKTTCAAEKIFCPELPHFVRWLRHRRWEDEIKTPEDIAQEKRKAEEEAYAKQTSRSR